MDPSTRHRRRAEGESQRQTSMGSGEGESSSPSHGKSEAQESVSNEAAELVRFARDYDVILYGATGFVGTLCAKYLAQAWTEQSADRGEDSAAVSANDARRQGPFRWAIAGKDRAKLIELRDNLAQMHAPFKDLDYFVADSDSRESIDLMVKRAQVILAAAGPFAELAPPVIEACVQHGTHYVDITGELDFMQDVVRKYHDSAARRGVHIVQACGFVAVPFDLAVLQLHLAAESAGTRLGLVEAFAKNKTTIGGGSAVSLMRLFDQPKERVARAFHPFSLNPPESQPPITLDDVGPYLPRLRLSERSMTLPFFPLGSVDMRVVRRSAALLDYGPKFHYQERMQTGWVVGLFLWFLMAVTQILLLIPAARRFIEKVRPPGSGPSEKLMREGFLDLKVEGKTENGKIISTRFQCGEPGYKETATMMCEAALCLALEQDKLVHTKGGVLTPATSMGAHLVKRLRKAGFGITEPTLRG